MAEIEVLQQAHDGTMELIGVVMLINLAWGALSPFIMLEIIEPPEVESSGGGAGALVFVFLWILFIIISMGALFLVVVRRSEAGATVGMMSGWPVALTIPLVVESNAYILLSSIDPSIMTVLTIRMLYLAPRIEWRRYQPTNNGHPVTDSMAKEGREPPQLKLYR